MKQSDYTYSSLPNDVALKIASSLEVPDLSSLGCCSRVWRDLCGSDCLWKSLVRERWPLLNEAALQDPNFKGWRGFYKKQHKEVAGRAASVVKFVEQCSLSESLEVSNYLKAIECLRSMQFGFKDVQMVLFKPKLNVLLNLVGLHYCLNCLQVPASHVTEALQSSKISDRQRKKRRCWEYLNEEPFMRFYKFSYPLLIPQAISGLIKALNDWVR
ncbi:hypothetical protein SCA6_015864 [Theobroma cacao]